jgi:hypothetical protein
MDKEKARKARQAEKQQAREVTNVQHAKNTPASGSPPSESNVNPQSGEVAQMQPTPGLPSAGLSTSHIPAPAVATRWARFWLAACCIPVQNANDYP